VLRVLDAAPASALPPAVGAPALPEAADPAVVARALGAASSPEGVRPGQQPVPSRLVLSGVAAGTSGRGTAIIAVDGAPPRAYPVGTRVAEGLVLQSVQGRRAQLGPGLGQPATVVLELPPLAR
jgi:general secretion pathway protein C